MDFLGRIDHQVKVRGHRIELGEIDAVLVGHPDVETAVTVVREHGPGDLRLVAYYVSARSSSELEPELRERIGRSLPEVMVPSTMVRLDEMPMTPNGKIDRKALPEPTAAGRAKTVTGAGATPRNELEQRIIDIWKEELGVERLSIDENFFDAGGHSSGGVQVRVAHCRTRSGGASTSPTCSGFRRSAASPTTSETVRRCQRRTRVSTVRR
ncbi:MAG: phosphopantetheine-binding protein [Gemmatimonadota bacterium]|nr:phosphopantetheine-binding protein [Gemmatimonadota bacterium]